MNHFQITLREYKDGGFVGHVQMGTDLGYIYMTNVYLYMIYMLLKPIDIKVGVLD